LNLETEACELINPQDVLSMQINIKQEH